MSDYVWRPSADHLASTNVARLIERFGVTDIDSLRSASVSDVPAFWAEVHADLGLSFDPPYSQVLDTVDGIEHPRWFVGAGFNAATASLDRWLDDDAGRSRIAVIHEREDGTVQSLTYEQLAGEVRRVRAGLRSRGIGRGDVVAMFLPMSVEAVVTSHAVAGLGAVLVPLFSGFGAQAIAARLQDAAAKAVVVAQGTVRRNKRADMKPLMDEALITCSSVETIVVVGEGHLTEREVAWDGLGGPDGDAEQTSAADVLLLAYTSGTTGKPKGAVHTHGGFVTKVASELAYGFDVRPGSVFSWVTDMGWIMGPLAVFGTHANGGTLLLYEGSPDVPDYERLWSVVERHRVEVLGVSPTLIRAMKAAGADGTGRDLSSVRTIGSTGEPWDSESYDWLGRDVLGARVPIINFSGGTEVGGSFLCPYPVEPIRSCSLGGPSLGMDVDVVDDSGAAVRGEIGELVCRQPWPSMTQSIWRDDERYLEAYWSRYPGIWHHGDHALIDSDGSWFILGRSDDVMNIGGKRVAPAEIESVVARHPAVVESAAVAVPQAGKGDTVWVFWTGEQSEDVASDLRERVAREVGKPFAPARIVHVNALPKTRSAKIIRRAVRAAALGADPGDMSAAENPEAVDAIRQVVSGL